MNIECQACHKRFHIPEERLPAKDKIAFPCPACRELITLVLRPPSEGLNNVHTCASSPVDISENRLTGTSLKLRILETVTDLPSMPETVIKAREIIADANSSFDELSTVLETDQAIAARILKIANSAYYGLKGTVSSIQHASVVLGYKTLEELITVAGTSNLLGRDLKGYEQDAGDLWQHSLAVAFGSKAIAARIESSLSDDAFAAGLIHDAGKLALDPYLAERKEMFREFMTRGDKSFLTAEKEVLGFDHAEIAYELCRNWSVPDTLTRAVRYHHDPSLSDKDVLAYIVHVADAIALMSGIGAGLDGMLYRIDDDALRFLGLRDEDIHEIMIEMVEAVQKLTDEMHDM